MDYKEHLKSAEWQVIRRLKLEEADYGCQLCGSDSRLEVHHRTYERLGRERLSDLLVLCRECHGRHHGILVADRDSRTTEDRRSVPGLGRIIPPEVQDERYVLLHAAAERRWLDQARSALTPECFQAEEHRRLFRVLLDSGPLPAIDPWSPEYGETEAMHWTLRELEAWREWHGFPLSEEAFRDSLRRLQLKAVERGVHPNLRPTGEPLADATQKSRLMRDIRSDLLKDCQA